MRRGTMHLRPARVFSARGRSTDAPELSRAQHTHKVDVCCLAEEIAILAHEQQFPHEIRLSPIATESTMTRTANLCSPQPIDKHST